MNKIKQGDYVYIDWELIKILNDLEITNGKEIMLFSKILSLSKKDKACTASNDYLSSFFCTTDRNIRKYLQDLKDKGLIKVFEQKEGLKTTTRYIYPQYDKLKLAPEEVFPSSDEGAEQKGQSTGTNVPDERNIHSEPAEQTDLLITEEIIKEKSIVDNDAASPIADAPKPDTKKKKELEYVITKEIKEQIWQMFKDGYKYVDIESKTGIKRGKIYSIIEDLKKEKEEDEQKEKQKRAEERLNLEANRMIEESKKTKSENLILSKLDDFKRLDFGSSMTNIDILNIIERTYYASKSNGTISDIKQSITDEFQDWPYSCRNIDAIGKCIDYLDNISV